MIVWTIVLTLLAGISMFYAGFGSLVRMHTAPKKAKIWGRTLNTIPAVEKMRGAGVLGWFGFVAAVIAVMIVALEYMWDSDYTSAIWWGPLLATVAGLLMGMLVVKPGPWLEKKLAESRNAACLGELPVVQQADEQIPNAETFVIDWYGIKMMDRNGYEYFTVFFQNYQLGNLGKDGSLALLGYYFREKYYGQFKYTAKVEKTTAGNYTVADGVSSITFTRIR